MRASRCRVGFYDLGVMSVPWVGVAKYRYFSGLKFRPRIYSVNDLGDLTLRGEVDDVLHVNNLRRWIGFYDVLDSLLPCLWVWINDNRGLFRWLHGDVSKGLRQPHVVA